jgi:transcription antitermination factor NusG
MRRWYAVYTRPRAEKKAAATLQNAGVETYCPVQKVRKKWHDRYKTIEEPIFTSYVFVFLEEAERSIVLANPNVLQFVHYCGKPAVIRDTEIGEIKRFLGEYEGSAIQIVTENDQVKITSGAFADKTGTVLKKFRHTACIRLEVFNAYLVAEIPDTRYVLA